MKKGIWTYIVSGVLGVVAVVGLLLLLLLPTPNKPPLAPANVYVQDITLDIGQTKTDFYQVSASDYEINFETDKEDIIEIDKDKIVAINPGKVKVTVQVIINENIVAESFYVTVLAPSYSYQLSSLSNCTFEGNTLCLTSQVAQFKIKIYDKDGVEVENPTLTYVASDGINVAYEFKTFKISVIKQGTITISVEQTGYSFTLSVIV